MTMTKTWGRSTAFRLPHCMPQCAGLMPQIRPVDGTDAACLRVGLAGVLAALVRQVIDEAHSFMTSFVMAAAGGRA
jgi:hypothetical protein